MKKKIIAFYDVLIYAIVCTPLMISSILILVFGNLNDFRWILEHWYLVILFACGVAIPLGGSLLFSYLIIYNNEAVKFVYFPYMNWVKAAETIDLRWNNEMFISEIESIEVVKLSKEEKKYKVSLKHWFNKYLKINLKYGKTKYVYVGNYSNYQIKKIIKLLTNHKKAF